MTEDHETRRIAGYKAAITNDSTSPAAKEHAQEMIDELTNASAAPGYKTRGQSDHQRGSHETEDEHHNRVVGGYKASLSNARTSSAARKHAEERIAELNNQKAHQGQHGKHEAENDDEHAHRIIGGHKANLANKNTSEESKQHSRDVLAEYGVPV